MLQEAKASGLTQAQYTDNPGYRGGLTSVRRAEKSRFFAFDLSANTRSLTDSTATQVAAYLFDAFGLELLARSAPNSPGFVPGMSPGFGGLRVMLTTDPNSLRYGGQDGYWRDLPNLMQVWQRWLRADWGRWVSPDTARVSG